MFELTLDRIVQVIALVLLLAVVVTLGLGWQQIRTASKLPFFMLRRRRIGQGWRLILIGIFFGVFTLFIQIFGRQVAYTIIPPTPSLTPTSTITSTPSITPTPTISPIPSITPTPTITSTPTITPTPSLPEDLREGIESSVTPNAEAALSSIEVARSLGTNNQAVNSSDRFVLPIDRLYGAFTYDKLQDGVQWTALWYLGNEVICQESIPWDGGTGGYGYTECEPERWVEGEYEIQIFLGEQWKVSTRFAVLREVPITETPFEPRETETKVP
ncbi:MAG: hypothetical protein A2Z14_03845 [Chloroflexi bacterium RBG_16_48_8]|nr:MAG: hypothetical protein A2Z14_03845 [Chloroflexi bacterium RBG_16_48_8]